MAEGHSAFNRIQVGDEGGTPGTAVAATEILFGTVTEFARKDVIHKPEEDRNNLSANMADDEIVGYAPEMTWEGDLNHRHMIWALLASIRGNITPTQPDSTNQPNAYLWTIAPALTSANTPDQSNGVETFTFEYGDDFQAYEMEYCFGMRLQLSGAVNEVCKFVVDIAGRQITDTTFTGALSAQSVQRFPFNLAKFYLDSSGANLGNTQKTGVLQAFTWTLDTQLRAFFAADGQLYFSSVKETKKKAELKLTYVRGTTSDAERTKSEARTTTFPRIELRGQTELDNGQSNVPYLIIDGAYRYFEWPKFEDSDGLNTVEVTAESVYDSTWGKNFEFQALTDLSALP